MIVVIWLGRRFIVRVQRRPNRYAGAKLHTMCDLWKNLNFNYEKKRLFTINFLQKIKRQVACLAVVVKHLPMLQAPPLFTRFPSSIHKDIAVCFCWFHHRKSPSASKKACYPHGQQADTY